MKNFLKLIIIPQDKANHFIWSLILCLLIFISFNIVDYISGIEFSLERTIFMSGFSALVISVLKEQYDYYTGKGTASWWDMLANIAGVFTFILIVYIAGKYH